MMMRVIILKNKINDILWPEIILVITHIKYLQLTRALEKFIRLIKIQN